MYLWIMILVTGATGLVGSHLLLQLLLQGKEVVALYRSEENKQRVAKLFLYYGHEDLFVSICWKKGDILDIPFLSEVFEGISYVYHCAACISFDPYEEEKMRKVNMEGTANIVNFCIAYKIQKLCYVSSIAALGDLVGLETEITEKSEWNPELFHSDYAITKYGAEMEVWRGYQEGLSVVIVNPGVILGPLFWEEGSGAIYKKIRKGLLFYTSGGTGFVSVLDVVKAMEELMNAAISGEKYILVAETLSYANITQRIAQKIGKPRPKYLIKNWILQLCWRMDWIFGLWRNKRMLSKAMANSLVQTDYYDTTKTKNILSFSLQSIEKYIESLH